MPIPTTGVPMGDGVPGAAVEAKLAENKEPPARLLGGGGGIALHFFPSSHYSFLSIPVAFFSSQKALFLLSSSYSDFCTPFFSWVVSCLVCLPIFLRTPEETKVKE